MIIQPCSNRILLKPVERKQDKQGLIIIPESAQQKPVEKEVVAVGPCVKKSGKCPMVKPGDIVLTGQFAGSEIVVDGQSLRFVEDSEVLGVVMYEQPLCATVIGK